MTSGTLRATAINAPGNEAKPPKPRTTWGRRCESTDHAARHAARIANGPNSSRFQPLPRTLEKSIAMAYVTAPRAAPGTALEIDVRGQRIPAEVVKLPFYRRA